MEPSYEIADARVRAIGGISAEHLSSFITWLGSQQYSAGYACIVARHALAFGRWCEANGIEVLALTNGEIERYQRSRARLRSRRPETRRQERQALKLLLLFLREKGICTAVASCITAVDRVCAEFAQHLRCNHGLAVATVDTYTRVARQFLAWRFGQAEVCLPDLRPSDSIAFVRHESMRMAPPAVKVAANALRSFLRFGEFRGELPSGLCAGVPSVATWTTTPPIPKAIAAAHAQRAIDSCDRLTALGRRDRAVLLLLARLGLSELTSLRQDDLHIGVGAHVRVIGKGRKERCTPLSKNTHAVLAAWAREPPLAENQPLFPNARGGRLSSHGVHYLLNKHVMTDIVKCPSLKNKRVSPHVLRHTTAMDLLQEGVDRSMIALWLGHESVETTQIYLDADLAIKQAVLDKTTPTEGTPGRYRPDDRLLAFLKGL